MLYRVRHDFRAGPQRHCRGEVVADPTWKNVRSLEAAGFVEVLTVPAGGPSSDPGAPTAAAHAPVETGGGTARTRRR